MRFAIIAILIPQCPFIPGEGDTGFTDTAGADTVSDDTDTTLGGGDTDADTDTDLPTLPLQFKKLTYGARFGTDGTGIVSPASYLYVSVPSEVNLYLGYDTWTGDTAHADCVVSYPLDGLTIDNASKPGFHQLTPTGATDNCGGEGLTWASSFVTGVLVSVTETPEAATVTEVADHNGNTTHLMGAEIELLGGHFSAAQSAGWIFETDAAGEINADIVYVDPSIAFGNTNLDQGFYSILAMYMWSWQ